MGGRDATTLAAVTVLAVLGILTGLVAAGATEAFDVTMREYFRPDDVWGALQVRVDVIVEGLKPRNVIPVLALVAALASLYRSSWHPVLYAGVFGAVAVTATLVLKAALGRTDPHGQMTAIGGSFPSGHVAVLLVCLGGSLLVLRERVRWWEWAGVALTALSMAWALVVQAAHWFTDVAGGLLLGTLLLVLASTSPLRAQRPGPRILRRRQPSRRARGSSSSAASDES